MPAQLGAQDYMQNGVAHCGFFVTMTPHVYLVPANQSGNITQSVGYKSCCEIVCEDNLD